MVSARLLDQLRASAVSL